MLATVRAVEVRRAVAALGAEGIGQGDLVPRAKELGGADVVIELVGAPNLESDLAALAMKGRIVIVGTGAGADAELSLRALMGKRARCAIVQCLSLCPRVGDFPGSTRVSRIFLLHI